MTEPLPPSLELEGGVVRPERALLRAAAVGQALTKARHDLNNLFHVARGWSRLLRNPRTPPEQIQEGIDAVLQASERTSDLIAGILALDGRASVGLELCDLRHKLGEFAQGLARLLPPERLLVELDATPLVVCSFAEVREALLDFVIDRREVLGAASLRLTLVTQQTQVTARLESWANGAPVVSEPAIQFRFSTQVAPLGSEAASPLARARTTPVSVLLVDDHRDVRRLATTILERAGYAVLTASDAEEALETSRNYDGPIEVLYCDARAPGPAAPHLIAELCAARPALKVLVCTGENTPRELEGYVKLGKPFSSQQLIDAVRLCHD